MGPLLQWKNDYCIGHDVIDGKHRKLFEIANQIFMIKNPLLDTEKIKTSIHELYDYMRFHFSHEEDYMAETSFPGIEDHKAKHREIISEMNEILLKSRNFIYLENNLVNLMHKWLLEHIIKDDLEITKSR